MLPCSTKPTSNFVLVPPEAAYLAVCIFAFCLPQHQGFPGSSDDRESAHNVGDLGPIPGSGRSPGAGHGNALQYSCLENPHRQRRLGVIIPGVVKSQAQLNDYSMYSASVSIYCSLPRGHEQYARPTVAQGFRISLLLFTSLQPWSQGPSFPRTYPFLGFLGGAVVKNLPASAGGARASGPDP